MKSSAQTIRSIVGKLDAFFLRAEATNGQDGAEDFFLDDLHVLGSLKGGKSEVSRASAL